MVANISTVKWFLQLIEVTQVVQLLHNGTHTVAKMFTVDQERWRPKNLVKG